MKNLITYVVVIGGTYYLGFRHGYYARCKTELNLVIDIAKEIIE